MANCLDSKLSVSKEGPSIHGPKDTFYKLGAGWTELELPGLQDLCYLGEEKMEEGDRGDQEEKRESQKGREQSSH